MGFLSAPVYTIFYINKPIYEAEIDMSSLPMHDDTYGLNPCILE